MGIDKWIAELLDALARALKRKYGLKEEPVIERVILEGGTVFVPKKKKERHGK